MAESWVGKQLTISTRGGASFSPDLVGSALPIALGGRRATAGFSFGGRQPHAVMLRTERRVTIVPRDPEDTTFCFGGKADFSDLLGDVVDTMKPRVTINWPDPCDSLYPFDILGTGEFECEEPEVPPVEWDELERDVKEIKVSDPKDPEIFVIVHAATRLTEQRRDTGEIHIHNYKPNAAPTNVEPADG